MVENKRVHLSLKSGKRSGFFVVESTRRRKWVHFKSLSGRGRICAMRVNYLFEDLREDFEKVRAAGVNVFCTLV